MIFYGVVIMGLFVIFHGVLITHFKRREKIYGLPFPEALGWGRLELQILIFLTLPFCGELQSLQSPIQPTLLDLSGNLSYLYRLASYPLDRIDPFPSSRRRCGSAVQAGHTPLSLCRNPAARGGSLDAHFLLLRHHLLLGDPAPSVPKRNLLRGCCREPPQAKVQASYC